MTSLDGWLVIKYDALSDKESQYNSDSDGDDNNVNAENTIVV